MVIGIISIRIFNIIIIIIIIIIVIYSSPSSCLRAYETNLPLFDIIVITTVISYYRLSLIMIVGNSTSQLPGFDGFST